MDFKSGAPAFQTDAGPPDVVGATYLHEDVAPGVDAVAVLTAIDSENIVSLTDFPVDGRAMLGGHIGDSQGGFFEWEVTLVDNVTGVEIPPVNLILTAFDIDGDEMDLTERDFVVFFDHDGYFTNTPSQVTATEITGNDVQIIATLPEIADGPATNPEFAGGAVYANTNTFTFRGGFTDPTTNPNRLVEVSGLFSEIDLFTLLNCVEPPPASPAPSPPPTDSPAPSGSPTVTAPTGF